ncbi:hypothetical protein ACWCPD_25765 [Streptomyces sp. NPDC001935]
MNDLLAWLIIIVFGVPLGGGLAYLMAGPPAVGPGTRVWRPRIPRRRR